MLLSDEEILELIDAGMISPAVHELVGTAERLLSYGISAYGYDLRLGEDFARYRARAPDDPLDPLNVREDDVIRFTASELVIPAQGFLLGTSVEWLDIPRDITPLLHDKSTYARAGLSVQNTVAEAGFKGHLTIEIHNQQPFPVRLYPGMGIGQLLFAKGSRPCKNSYADRKGKYMNQRGTTLPRA